MTPIDTIEPPVADEVAPAPEPAMVVVVMLALGAYVFARVERRCRQLGTLGPH